MHRPRRARRAASSPSRPLPVALVALAATCLALVLGACSGSAPESPATSGAAPSVAPSVDTRPPVTTTVTVRKLTGKLSKADKAHLKAAVKDVVDRYLDAAFFGSYPRTGFDDAFKVFTPGARERAEKDVDLLTNAGLGRRVQAVTARNRRVRLDVLSVKGHPAGVIARFAVGLRIVNSDGKAHTQRVTGSLSLTNENAKHADTGSWQVFAYDVTRGEAS